MALGMISIVWFVSYIFDEEYLRDKSKSVLQKIISFFKSEYFKNFLIFGVISLILSLPQLFFWTFKQASGGNFLRFHFDWVNSQDNWVWFWIKNVGIVFILLIPALIRAKKDDWKFYSGALFLFVISELFLFQPNDYDNNKLFLIWYIFTVIIVSKYAVIIFEKMKEHRVREKWFFAGVFLFLATFSGLLTIAREELSNYVLFEGSHVQAAKFVEKNTPKDALFLTSNNHNNSIASLSGRSVFCGTSIYLYFHGVNYAQREGLTREMYANPANFAELSKANKIDYVYISNYERSTFKASSDSFSALYPAIFQSGDVIIFAVSERAKSFKINEKH